MITSFYSTCLSVSTSSSRCPPINLINRYLSSQFISQGNDSNEMDRGRYLHQIEEWWKSIPDIRWSIQDILVDGNKATVRAIVSGTPIGQFFHLELLDGSASFAMMSLSVFTIERRDGESKDRERDGRYQIRSMYHLEDWDGAIHQINRTRLSELSVSAAYSFCG